MKNPGFEIFAVRYNFDAALNLFTYTIADSVCQNEIEFALVVGLACVLGLQQVEQVVRSWQTADVGRLNMIGVLLSRHGHAPLAVGSR